MYVPPRPRSPAATIRDRSRRRCAAPAAVGDYSSWRSEVNVRSAVGGLHSLGQRWMSGEKKEERGRRGRRMEHARVHAIACDVTSRESSRPECHYRLTGGSLSVSARRRLRRRAFGLAELYARVYRTRGFLRDAAKENTLDYPGSRGAAAR